MRTPELCSVIGSSDSNYARIHVTIRLRELSKPGADHKPHLQGVQVRDPWRPPRSRDVLENLRNHIGSGVQDVSPVPCVNRESFLQCPAMPISCLACPILCPHGAPSEVRRCHRPGSGPSGILTQPQPPCRSSLHEHQFSICAQRHDFSTPK